MQSVVGPPLGQAGWCLAALGSAWALALHACWWEWNLNPQYSYGLLVPLLSVLLFARRWPDRPLPIEPLPAEKFVAMILAVAAGVLLAALQPMVVSNADWRMVPTLAAASAATFTLALVFLAGGWSWMRHFAFPVLFFLVAVPWPRPQEDAIMSWLMSHNTALCVEALHWMEYPAEQSGNLIAIPGSLLGVEEACSGIRSLQSMIMVSLAIGEFFRLSATRRVALFVFGIAAALAGNAVRSLVLSLAACRSGSGAVDRIHDGAGLVVLVSASAAVLIVGRILTRPRETAPAVAEKYTLHFLHGMKRASVALLALWVVAWAGGEAWFRFHEAKPVAAPPIWTLSPLQPGTGAREAPVAERTLDILLYPDTAKSEQWTNGRGWQWQAFYFHWPPGPTSVQSAFIVHDPRVCLGAAGFELERRLPPWIAEVGGFRIPFQRYIFRDRGRPVHVFHAVVEDDGTPGAVDAGFTFDAGIRLQNVRRGKRNRGLRVLEFAVRGPTDATEAESAAKEWLERRVVADKQSDK